MRMDLHNTIEISEVSNVFDKIGKEWFLITAGTLKDFNTMTAAWGGFGVLWHKNVCTIYVRPNRYTFQFLEKYEHFTLSFFSEAFKEALQLCGTCSGRLADKMKQTGLSPLETSQGAVYYKEASLVIECKKIYSQDFDPDQFLDDSIEKNYPNKDYHRVYIGEILSCLQK